MSLPPAGGSRGFEVEEDRASTIRQPSFDFSDHDVSDNGHEDHLGDYSTRMDELFEDGEDQDLPEEDEEDDDDGAFLYTGVDAADIPTGYKDQLRDVLGPELTDDDEIEADEVERSLVMDGNGEILHSDDDESVVSSYISKDIN